MNWTGGHHDTMITEVSENVGVRGRREWRITKNAVKMKSETQVLRTFMGVGGFGRTCFNKMPGELTLKGGLI